MNFESQIPNWLESFLKDPEQMSAFGRAFLVVAFSVLTGILTWLGTKVGWWGLKLTGRGARACWPGKAVDTLSREITQAILVSLDKSGRKAAQLQRVVFPGGSVDLVKKQVWLGEEDLAGLLSRRQHRQLAKAAQRVHDRISAQDTRAHKEAMLVTLKLAEPPPVTLQELHAQQTRDDEIHSLFVNVFGENGS